MYRSSRSLNRSALAGLSLLELMVSMALGLILSGGIVTAYLVSKQHYFYDEQVARMQENGRYAMRLLSREIAMAGFYGGALSMAGVSAARIDNDCGELDWALDAAHSLDLVNDFPGESSPVSSSAITLGCVDIDTVQPGSDLLAIKRTAAQWSLQRGLTAPGLTASSTETWYLRRTPGQQPHWEQLRPRDLSDPARTDATSSYWEAIARVFFIRNFTDAQSGNEQLPTLCMETLAGNGMVARCLVEGVEDLQFEFGIDTDDDGVPNHYLDTPTSAELQRAVTARVHLLLRSIREIAGYRNTKEYSLGQKVVTPGGDGFLRRVFSMTVRVRNRTGPLG